jgi:hypothetical protein
MFFMSAYFLSISGQADKSRYIYIAYSAVLFSLITIAMAANLFFGQEMWIGASKCPSSIGIFLN